MIVVCSGSRDWTDDQLVDVVIEGLGSLCRNRNEQLVLVHGNNPNGADAIVEGWRHIQGVDVRAMSADWKRYGKRAGPIRNRQMLDEKPDLVVAFHDDLENSKGTKDCVEEAARRHIPVWHLRHVG